MLRRLALPLGLLATVLAVLAVGLTLNPRELPSPLIGRMAPRFALPELRDPSRIVTPDDMNGRVWLLNVWASWCVACRQEHALLVDLSRTGAVPLIGLDYKDNRNAGLEWLHDAGDPYILSLADGSGRTAMDFGVYGVPETFVIDRSGVIRYRHTGPLSAEDLQGRILPLVKELNG
jgi:cytochrome c biogenesis protein CcmG/thiol:disulfide interchange protein DsbE